MGLESSVIKMSRGLDPEIVSEGKPSSRENTGRRG